MTYPLVLCLGELLWDCFAESSSPDQAIAWVSSPGGAPANVACALAKLGIPSGFIGAVGVDDAGEALIEVMRSHQVNTTGIQRHPTPTRQVEIWRDEESGEGRFVRFRRGALPNTASNATPNAMPLASSDLADAFADAYLQADRLPIELFMTADYLVLGTLELAYPDTRRAIARALELADQHYLKILVDINWRPVFWPDPDRAKPLIHALIQRVDFLKLSRSEAEWLFNTTDPGVISHRFDHLEGVLITDGAAGCTYCFNHIQGHWPAFVVDGVDTTGAGDSFVAGFLHQLCQRGIQALNHAQPIEHMLRYASAVAALTTLERGAIAPQPTAATVAAFLAAREPFKPLE